MKKIKVLDSTSIKIIAIVLMFCDHVHQMFLSFGAPGWLTWLGRPVFVLFLFASADAFHYTRDRKKYLLRLLFASWAMTALTLLTQFVLPNQEIVLMNNAFTTFFLTALCSLFWERLRSGVKEKRAGKIITSVLLFFVPVLTFLPVFVSGILTESNLSLAQVIVTISLFLPNYGATEGGILMVALGLLFYIFREKRLVQVAILAALSAMIYFMSNSVQALMVFAALPMLMYNGRKGRGMKYFFYVFYPAHIILLYIAATLLR
ncbi:MAG: conjugal transfer protein TraX [Clostridium sp.]|jgi:hypothetical protein|nr:conjugal transfer protein TraX [Clostridium sp.]